MKTRQTILSIATVGILAIAFAYTYHLGYSRGGDDERLHWLWTPGKDGAWTVRENPAHPAMPPAIVRARQGIENSIPVTADSKL
jgi:hypothetical protein